MAKRNGTHNDLQNATQKTKDRALWTLLKMTKFPLASVTSSGVCHVNS